MNIMIKNKFVMLALLTLLFSLGFFRSSYALPVPFQITTGTFEDQGIVDQNGYYLWGDGGNNIGCLLQIIILGSSEPSPPNKDGSPGGLDTLYAPDFVGNGFPFDPAHGRFATTYEVNLEPGTRIIVRGWNSTEVSSSTHYGNSPIFTVSGSDWVISTSETVWAFKTDTLFDIVAPGPPSNFIATPEASGDIILTWTPTTEPDTKGTLIVYRTDRSPTNELDGMGEVCDILTSEPQSYRHTGLTEGTTYEYGAFSYDFSYNYSGPANTSEVSHDTAPPNVISVSPSNGATGVSVSTTIDIVFDDNMSTPETESSLSSYPSFGKSFSWLSSRTHMVVSPTGSLSPGITYMCTVDTTAKDDAGNLLSSRHTWSFSVASGLPPYISDMKIGGYKVYPGDSISSQPKITAYIFDPEFMPPLCGISSIEISADGTVHHYSSPELSAIFDRLTGYLDYRFPAKLDPGTYTITLRAWDVAGNITEESVTGLRVRGGETDIDGPVLCYPYEFESGQGTIIAYKLTVDGTVWIKVYSIRGLVYNRDVSAGSSGGTAGYNEVAWNGLSGRGDKLGNGMYIVKIYNSNDKPIGSAKVIIRNRN